VDAPDCSDLRRSRVMTGLTPGVVDERAEQYGGPVFAAVGLLLLGGCTVWAALTDHGGTAQWQGTLAWTAVTAAVLTGVAPLFPRRKRYPLAVVAYYLAVVGLALLLASRDNTFTAFASIGYPFAFALFPARWSVFGVAATAAVPMLARGGFGSDSPIAAWVVIVSVVGPLLYAAWFVGLASDRQHRANQALAETNAKLETALEENSGLHAQLLSQAREAGIVDERQRMAGEIHDTLAQGLAGIVTQLQAADRAVDEQGRARHLAHVHTLAKESLTEARRSVLALRPEPLTVSRLPEAVAELGRKWSETSGVPIRVETTGDARPLLPDLEVTLYRVAQESLANAGKHAGASMVGLTLSYSDDVVMLDVRDNGVGFAPEEVRPQEDRGFGLEAMRQRLTRAGGTLAIESAPGDGTAVNAQVPAVPAESGKP
jgi:signal transduction histidine kinase